MPELVITVAITTVVSSVISATIAAVISKAKMVKDRSDRAREDAADMKELMMQNTLMTCRMAIYDEHFSIDEKLEAYKVYASHGWNHQTKTYMDEQVGCDVDEYIVRHGI